ncbi:MAG: alkaline phosphatase family protein [Chloroflexota bacterium]
MKNTKINLCILTCLLIISLMNACSPTWSLSIENPDGSFMVFQSQDYNDLLAFENFSDNVALERLLWLTGYTLVDQITVISQDETAKTYNWDEIAHDAIIDSQGKVCISDSCIRAQSINVKDFDLEEQINASIMDIAPTIASALGIPAPNASQGKTLTDITTDHVTAILLDGLGYQILSDASLRGLTPEIDKLNPPLLASTVYPPITNAAMAAFSTGASPEKNKVTSSCMRKPALKTIFTALANFGKQSVAIEGESLPINLIDCQAELSGDRDGNGSTDDNVLSKALNILNQENIPDFLFIHFHGIDDAGHTYGITSPEYKTAIQYIDQAVGQIISKLPQDSLLIIFADHGMHTSQNPVKKGTHGNLFVEDMLIPIIIYPIH